MNAGEIIRNIGLSTERGRQRALRRLFTALVDKVAAVPEDQLYRLQTQRTRPLGEVATIVTSPSNGSTYLSIQEEQPPRVVFLGRRTGTGVRIDSVEGNAPFTVSEDNGRRTPLSAREVVKEFGWVLSLNHTQPQKTSR